LFTVPHRCAPLSVEWTASLTLVHCAPQERSPVCGTDGVTYTCSLCPTGALPCLWNGRRHLQLFTVPHRCAPLSAERTASLTRTSVRCGFRPAGVSSSSWLRIRETAVSNTSLGRGLNISVGSCSQAVICIIRLDRN
jgi:hypothetical protein